MVNALGSVNNWRGRFDAGRKGSTREETGYAASRGFPLRGVRRLWVPQRGVRRLCCVSGVPTASSRWK